MELRHAIEMLAGSGVGTLGRTVWSDLGCGDGLFTRALASLLAAGSTIHAVDRDTAALRNIPDDYQGVSIATHHADFTAPGWPGGLLDGILMANSLHYVRDPATFIRQCLTRLSPPRRFLIVEYDTDKASAWVPFPISRARLPVTFDGLGAPSIRYLGARPSIYHRAPLYAALLTSSDPVVE